MKAETPCIVIDMNKVEQNLKRMADICKKHNCKLRPHVKTHKMIEFAKLQLMYGASGITVAKLSEAEVMAAGGINDIFAAYPIIGDEKIKRAIELSKKIRFIGAVDCYDGAKAISDKCLENGAKMEVRMEIDTGMRRTGVLYEKALEEALKINELEGIVLQGIFTFRGMMFDGETLLDRKKCGIQEAEIMAELAQKMRDLGLNIIDVSTGSTPTAEFNAEVSGVTEVRPGTYIFNDMMQLNTHACESLEDIAAYVMTTVVSTCKDHMIVIDGGCKSFSTDGVLDKFPYFLKGHGKVIGHNDLYFNRISEEHGMLEKSNTKEVIHVGDILSIIPNHICPTINLFDEVYIMKDGKIVDKLKVSARGKNY